MKIFLNITLQIRNNSKLIDPNELSLRINSASISLRRMQDRAQSRHRIKMPSKKSSCLFVIFLLTCILHNL